MTASASLDETIFLETTDQFWVLRLVTEVRESGMYVRLHPFQGSFRRILPDQIQDVDVTSYAAMTYSGWHWGCGERWTGTNRIEC